MKWWFQQWLRWGFELFTGLDDLYFSIFEECLKSNEDGGLGRQVLLGTSLSFCTKFCRLSCLLYRVKKSLDVCGIVLFCIKGRGRITSLGSEMVLRENVLLLISVCGACQKPWPLILPHLDLGHSATVTSYQKIEFDSHTLMLQVIFREYVCILWPQQNKARNQYQVFGKSPNILKLNITL